MTGWSVSRAAGAALVVFSALLLQTTVLARLPLPGGAPDLPLVVVIAYALAGGPGVGLGLGFGAGLLVDLVTGHALGLLGLVYAVVGWGAGSAVDDGVERSALTPVVVVAGGAAAAVLLYAGLGALFSDPRSTVAATLSALPVQVVGGALLAPFVVPVVARLSGRTRDGAYR